MSFDVRALDWLRGHHTTISTTATVDGNVLLPPALRRRLVSTGELQRVVAGSYVFGGVPVDELARCAAVCTS